MSFWSLMLAFLQVVAICLAGQGGLILSLSGFDPDEVEKVKTKLTDGLTTIAVISVVILLVGGLAFGQFANWYTMPKFAEPLSEEAEKEFSECLEVVRLADRSQPALREPGSTLLMGQRNCVEQIAKKFDLKLNRRATLLELLKAHPRPVAAVVAVLIILPILVRFSVGMERLKTRENRIDLIANSCFAVYAGVILQLFQQILTLAS